MTACASGAGAGAGAAANQTTCQGEQNAEDRQSTIEGLHGVLIYYGFTR